MQQVPQSQQLNGTAAPASATAGAPGRKYVFYGVGSVGKSTLAADAPDPVFLCAEDGAFQIDAPKLAFDESGAVSIVEGETSDRIIPRALTEVMSAIRYLLDADRGRKTLVIDGLGEVDQLVMDEVLRQNPKWKSIQTPGFGTGESEVLKTWRAVIARLDDLRFKRQMNVILIGHSQVVKFKNPEGPEFDRYQLAVTSHPKGDVAGFLFNWSDMFGFCRFETLTNTENKRTIGVGQGARMLHLARHNAFDAKCRYRGVRDMLPLSWGELASEIANAQTPARTRALREEIERLLARVDDETRAAATQWLATVGNDALALSQAVDRLRGKVMIQEQQQEQQQSGGVQ